MVTGIRNIGKRPGFVGWVDQVPVGDVLTMFQHQIRTLLNGFYLCDRQLVLFNFVLPDIGGERLFGKKESGGGNSMCQWNGTDRQIVVVKNYRGTGGIEFMKVNRIGEGTARC